MVLLKWWLPASDGWGDTQGLVGLYLPYMSPITGLRWILMVHVGLRWIMTDCAGLSWMMLDYVEL